jgi:hypothetical protein
MPLKALLTADLHANRRLPGNLEHSMRVYSDMGYLCEAYGLTTLIVAGDILDAKYAFDLELLLRLRAELLALKAKGIHVILLPGNHDKPRPQDPEYTPLALLQDVATVLFHPWLHRGEDYTLVLMPWFPPEQFKALVKAYTMEVMRFPGPKYLITHVGLNEGKVSPSNRSVEQPVRLEDLYPNVYTEIYLGDYHAFQEVSRNCRYLSSPIPHTFGDWNNVGVWVLDLPGSHRAVRLPSRYPEFKRWRIGQKEDLPLPGYDKRDRHRIEAPLDLLGTVKLFHPEAEVEGIEGEIVVEGTRLEDPAAKPPEQIAGEWLKMKGYAKKVYDPLIKEYLGRVRL